MDKALQKLAENILNIRQHDWPFANIDMNWPGHMVLDMIMEGIKAGIEIEKKTAADIVRQYMTGLPKGGLEMVAREIQYPKNSVVRNK